MAMAVCKECKKEVSAQAATCPHCGVKNPGITSKDAVAGLVGIAVIIGVLYLLFGEKTDENSHENVDVGEIATESVTAVAAPTAEIKAAANALEDMMPPGEKRVIAIVDDYAHRYKAAGNELQKSALWKERTQAISKAMVRQKGDPEDEEWVGILENMQTTGDGNAYITVRISPIITVSTWNNEFSDIGDHTLIKNGSAVYKSLLNLKPGVHIKFAFSMQMQGKGLLEEGRMTEPDFLARFNRIEAVAKSR